MERVLSVSSFSDEPWVEGGGGGGDWGMKTYKCYIPIQVNSQGKGTLKRGRGKKR